MSPFPPTLLSLPTELVVEIISFAVVQNKKKEGQAESESEFEACKTLSTTCRLFRDILAPRLFRSFTLEYIDGSLVGLNGLKLATSPHAQHVKLLTFDLLYYTVSEEYLSSFSALEKNDHDEQIPKFGQDQHPLVEIDRDLTHLSTYLRPFKNLQHVEVNYHTQPQRRIPDRLNTWSQHFILVFRAFHKLQSVLTSPIQSLSTKGHCPIPCFLYDNKDKQPLEAKIFEIKTIFTNLTSLKMEHCAAAYYTLWEGEAIISCLEFAKSLKFLELSSDIAAAVPTKPWQARSLRLMQRVLNLHFPRLVELNLVEWYISLLDLVAFCSKHGETLRAIKLHMLQFYTKVDEKLIPLNLKNKREDEALFEENFDTVGKVCNINQADLSHLLPESGYPKHVIHYTGQHIVNDVEYHTREWQHWSKATITKRYRRWEDVLKGNPVNGELDTPEEASLIFDDSPEAIFDFEYFLTSNDESFGPVFFEG